MLALESGNEGVGEEEHKDLQNGVGKQKVDDHQEQPSLDEEDQEESFLVAIT
jgi:hypothetical protein